MNLMFWKKKQEGSDAAEASGASSGPLARIKALVTGLTGKLKSPPPFKAEIPAAAETEASSSETASPGPDAATENAPPAGIKSRLLSLFLKPAAAPANGKPGEAPRRINPMAVAVLLLLLLLAAFGYAVWSIVLSSPDPKNGVSELIEDNRASGPPLTIAMPASAPLAASDAQASSAPVGTDVPSAVPVAETQAEQAISAVAAAPASHAPQTELEELRQKNAELQAQIDALKKAHQPSAVSVKLYPGSSKNQAAGGVATVGNSDPKATAATLKEAIEMMNAGSNYKGKQAK